MKAHLQIGKVYIQRHSDMDCYVMPLKALKAGGFSGLLYNHMISGRKGGRAVFKSLAHMYPAPELVDDVPEWIMAKFEART